MSFMDRINAVKASIDAPVDEAKVDEAKKGNHNQSNPALRAVFAKAFSKGKKGDYNKPRTAKQKTGVAKAGETYNDAEYFKNFRKEYADTYNPELKLDASKAADSSIRRQGKSEGVDEAVQYNLDKAEIAFLKKAAPLMGGSISWQSLAARPEGDLTKKLLAKKEAGMSAADAVKAISGKSESAEQAFRSRLTSILEQVTQA